MQTELFTKEYVTTSHESKVHNLEHNPSTLNL